MKTSTGPTRGPLTQSLQAWIVGVGMAVASGISAVAQPPETSPSWTVSGNLNMPRRSHTATLLPSGKVMIVGGVTDSGNSFTVLGSVELYDPATGTWRLTGSLNLPRYLCSTTLLADGKVLVAGGYSHTQPPSFGITDTVELYDPATESWSLSGNMSMPRAWHTAVRLPSGVLVVGGYNGIREVSTLEIYEPQSGTWSVSGNLIGARYGSTATLLADGKVLVAAGSDDGDLASTLNSVELYDTVARTSRSSGSLGTRRFSHSATLLPSGLVLVAAGYNWPPESFATAELYDPLSERWSYTGSLNMARDSHAAIVLPNGKVLVAGGYQWPALRVLDSAEIYDPMTGTWSDTASARQRPAAIPWII